MKHLKQAPAIAKIYPQGLPGYSSQPCVSYQDDSGRIRFTRLIDFVNKYAASS